MVNLIYPELSYKVIGIAFEINKKIGYGFQEKVYQKAFAIELKNNKINFQEQLCHDLLYKNSKIAKYFLDFLIEDKLVLELKVGKFFKKKDFDQTLEYLKAKNLKLGILILFSPNGVEYKRILN